MAEEPSSVGRGRRAARRVREAVTATTGTLTGKNLEQEIAEYSETYTQVLLGVHRDLEAQSRTLSSLDSALEALKNQVAEHGEFHGRVLPDLLGTVENQTKRLDAIASDVEGLKRQVTSLYTLRVIAVAAFVLAIASAGGVLWTDL